MLRTLHQRKMEGFQWKSQMMHGVSYMRTGTASASSQDLPNRKVDKINRLQKHYDVDTIAQGVRYKVTGGRYIMT